MGLDPLRRFSSRVADYVRYRPGYPESVSRVLESECSLRPDWTVADIGSGTGLLSRLFLDFGCTVYGVEPNDDMRRAGDHFLAAYPRYTSIAGRAEATGLKFASVDLVTAGQAFHWFDADAARTEFARILKPGRWVALVWNERLVSATPFLEDYEALLRRFAPEYAVVDHRRIDAAAVERFFGHSAYKRTVFSNSQQFALEALEGRVRSSSYVPLPGMPGHDEFMSQLRSMFAQYQKDGRVEFLYETVLYYGRLTSAA